MRKAVRSTGRGLGYNSPRLLAALAPYVIGALAALEGIGIASALLLTSAFYVAAGALIFAFPETSGKALEA